MSKKELLCKGSVYEMRLDENGNEKHIECMTFSGKGCSGKPCMMAHNGKFPNWQYVVTFDDAYDQLLKWWVCGLEQRLEHKEFLTFAYKHNRKKQYDDLTTGEVFYDMAFDINYRKADGYYTSDGVIRYKFVFIKA